MFWMLALQLECAISKGGLQVAGFLNGLPVAEWISDGGDNNTGASGQAPEYSCTEFCLHLVSVVDNVITDHEKQMVTVAHTY